jgi:hypothetical protein
MNKLDSLINCNTCKIRKVKCSRELPNCSYCLKRDMMCIYPDKIRRRGVSQAELALFISKIKFRPSVELCELTFRSYENNESQEREFTIFQPTPQPNDFVDESMQRTITKMQSNGTRKFQTYALLMLSTQIVEYDSKLVPQIDFFVSKLELGVLVRLMKLSINMDQEWVVELLSPSFEEKCITSYFQNFHPMATYISKYKFYTNYNTICPVLKSVIILAGYSSTSKQSPELLKYLKHMVSVQLKKNMFNVRMSICQALFIFTSYLLYQGLGKQSLKYFHQAYLMASALGVHVDIPGLNGVNTDERRCVRFVSYRYDSHLSSITSNQPHYLFLAPSWTLLNPVYQTNPYSKDPNEFLIAECICLFIKCFNMYWTISTNLMNNYSQLTLTNQQASMINNYGQAAFVLQMLFNHALIQTLDLHLSLSSKCKNTEELKIVKNFAKIHVGLYHIHIIILNSQLSPENPTIELDQSTKKLLQSAHSLYQNSIDVGPFFIPIFYQNLCTVCLLYIKLILIYSNVPDVKELLLESFKQVYRLSISYRSIYDMPNDLIEAINIITNYFDIKIE